MRYKHAQDIDLLQGQKICRPVVQSIVDSLTGLNSQINLVFAAEFGDSIPLLGDYGALMQVFEAFGLGEFFKFFLEDFHELGNFPGGFLAAFLEPEVHGWVGEHAEVAAADSKDFS
jgi:hypothetical protein